MVSESFVHACAGGAGGLVSMTLTYPLMGISTRAAVDRSKNPGESLLKAVTTVIAKEGVRGLYDGLSSSLIGIGVANFVYYFFFEAARDFIVTSKRLARSTSGKLGTLTTLESIVAGLIAGTATALISNPIWVVNTRQTVRVTQKDEDSTIGTKKVVKRLSFLETLRSIVEKDGVKALWKGIGPALVLVTNPVLQYTVFEQIKNWVLKSRLAARGGKVTDQPLLRDIDFFWLGALSKLIATSITYPQIVIKSRQQALSNDNAYSQKKVNVWTAMTDVVQEEGFGGLYRGISSKLLQSILTAAILFASKERIYNITKALLVQA
ncbi:ATP transmembrane transporter [Malassezia pachydermatis]|uniref:Mitochondrial carrier n=1 Tax=Malassezia pachydermatis TaxID=77020 RepID=A0A0M8MXX9_9BASI|nr:mitochondrial carrier [Malassezia pachydermatis]KOS16574.1 mitochondrial carrier [Malassezia pachydermatis]